MSGFSDINAARDRIQQQSNDAPKQTTKPTVPPGRAGKASKRFTGPTLRAVPLSELKAQKEQFLLRTGWGMWVAGVVLTFLAFLGKKPEALSPLSAILWLVPPAAAAFLIERYFSKLQWMYSDKPLSWQYLAPTLLSAIAGTYGAWKTANPYLGLETQRAQIIVIALLFIGQLLISVVPERLIVRK